MPYIIEVFKETRVVFISSVDPDGGFITDMTPIGVLEAKDLNEAALLAEAHCWNVASVFDDASDDPTVEWWAYVVPYLPVAFVGGVTDEVALRTATDHALPVIGVLGRLAGNQSVVKFSTTEELPRGWKWRTTGHPFE
jgi:hypothetical protein